MTGPSGDLAVGARVVLTPDGGSAIRCTIVAVEPIRGRFLQVRPDGTSSLLVVPRDQVRALDVIERVGELGG